MKLNFKKVIIFIIILLLAIFLIRKCHQSSTPTSSEEGNVALVEHMYTDVSEKMNLAKVDSYFAPDFELISNETHMNYGEFKDHLGQVFNSMKGIEIKKPFADIFSKNDKVVTRFTILTTDKNGNKVEKDVIAIYQIKNNKIYRWWELTYPAW
ncbi:MAG: nuclear transport factor 2 family protein [Gammaproteobacteria bacterium]